MSKQIEIVLNERTLKCSFGLGFLGECLENLGLNVFEIGKKLDDNPFKWIPVLMYESAKYTDKDLNLSLEELIELLDTTDGNKEMAKFLGAFVQSLNKDVPIEKGVKPSKNVSKKK